MTDAAGMRLMVMAALLALTACGGDGGSTAPVPTPAPAPSTGQASDCFAASLYANGARYTLNYGPPGGGVTENRSTSVNSPVRFTRAPNLVDRTDLTELVTRSSYLRDGAVYKVTQTTRWLVLDGYIERQYAIESLLLVDTDNPQNPQLNVPAGSASNTPTSDGVNRFSLTLANPSATDGTRTVVYKGQETLSTPAGTFETCRFHTSDSYWNSSNTEWYARGKGVLVRREDSTPATLELKSIQ